MMNFNFKLLLATALAAAIITGCGGGGGGGGTPAPDISQNVSDLIAYMESLIATSENSDLVDIDALTLVLDDTGEPTAF